MKRKSLLIAFFVLALAVFAAACGGNADNGDQSGAASNNTANGQETETSESDAAETSAEEASETEAGEAEQPAELVISHQLGETKVKTNPEKVAVFDFGVLDTLDKLGIEVSAVPQANIPGYLSKYNDAKYVNAGSLKEPDFEALAELQPDVIFISGRQSSVYEQLSEIAPTIYMGVDTSNYMESFKNNMNIIGQIFGKQEEIEAELADLDARIQALNEKLQGQDIKGLIVLTTGGKVSAYGPGSRFGFIHDVFGVPAADDTIEASTHGMSISFEYILEKNPDYLFVVDRDAVVQSEGSAPAKSVIENSLVQNTTAYKEGHIVYLNPEYWYLSGVGLVSLSEMLAEIEQAFE